MLAPVESVTHAHLVYALASELSDIRTNAAARVLDGGCGNGELMLAIHRHLPTLIDREIIISGFDVGGLRIQKSDFFESTSVNLCSGAPEVDWQRRLSLIDTKSEWPYPDESFDATVSNQVFEHVADLDLVLGEIARVLKPGGISLNLFPVRASIIEGHVGAPYAHRIASDDVRRSYLTFFAKFGLARLGPMRMAKGLEPAQFGATRSEYVATQTCYRSFRELAERAHRHGLTISYRWTPQFFLLKLGYVFGKDVTRMYLSSRRARFLEWLTFGILSRISSVTVLFRKEAVYDPNAANAGHL